MICLFEFSNIKVRNIFKVNSKNTRRRSDVFIAESHVILVGFFYSLQKNLQNSTIKAYQPQYPSGSLK